MVEFAIVLPFLVLLMVGVIEIGRYMFFGIEVAHAAEAGAQWGSQSLTNMENTTGGVQAAVNADAPSNGITSWQVTPTEVCTYGGATAPCPSASPPVAGYTYYENVKITGTLNSLLNYPGIPSGIPVSASTTMRVLTQ